jgi:hypothetical protein
MLGNWLRFTHPSTRILIHMDRGRAANFTNSSETTDAQWRWLFADEARGRVLVNPRRLRTYKRSGSLLAAHVHNFLFANAAFSRDPPTHFAFLASNCFFIRPGLETFVGVRGSSVAIRGCPEVPVKPNRHHCTQQPWFAALNGHRPTARRQLVEGQFFPVAFMSAFTRQLEATRVGAISSRGGGGSASDSGGSRSGALPPSLLRLLETNVGCTAEENLLPAVVLRAPARLVGDGPPTEPIAWIPRSLANGSFIDRATVRWLAGSFHTPQLLCNANSGSCGACPDPRAWPQTKFVVKRVADDFEDRSGVRRLIDTLLPSGALPGASSST